MIPNGIDLSVFQSSPFDETAPYKGKRVTYISRLEGSRGYNAGTLLDSAPMVLKAFSDTEFVIVGAGDMMATIQKKADILKREYGNQAVWILGERKDIPQILQKTDISVGVGRVALESMATGKAVIIAGEAGFMGAVTPDNFMMGKEHNFSGRGESRQTTAEHLADEIITLLKNPSNLRTYGLMGREMMEQYFSITSMTQRIVAVYREAGTIYENH